MANFEQHVTFSSLLGTAYGTAAALVLEFSPVQGALAGCLAAIGGMLPDLDAPHGRPGREVFSLTAAVAPLVMIGKVLQWTGLPTDTETVMLVIVALYVLIRYGVAALVHRLSVHRGMFHSIPAMLLTGEIVYLCYPGGDKLVKLLMGGAVTVGFLSHLLLDELYSVEWKGTLPGLKKSSGTALKFFGTAFGSNVLTYALFGSLTYAVLLDNGLVQHARVDANGPTAEQQAPIDILPPEPSEGIILPDNSLAPIAPAPEWSAQAETNIFPADDAAAVDPYRWAEVPPEELTDAPLFR